MLLCYVYGIRVCQVGHKGMVVLFYRDKRGSRVDGVIFFRLINHEDERSKSSL